MSLWADYLNEREGVHVLEKEHGFAVYELHRGEVCYIRDIYVVPHLRHTGLARELADEVVRMVKLQGVKVLVGSVATNAVGATYSLKILLAYGMTLASLDLDKKLLYFRKEI